MKTNIFKRVCENLTEIAHMPTPARDKHLDLFMSQGYLFLDLTDKQVTTLKVLFKREYPNIYREFPEPDDHGFTAEFKYLLFK